MFCVVVQGAKEVMIGEHQLRYGRGACFVGSVELPVTARIVEASAERPYIALTMMLDLDKVASLAAELPTIASGAGDGPGFGVKAVTEGLLEPWLRLLKLLETPDDIPALAPMIERELLYRLLTGPHRGIVRQLVGNDNRIARVRRAINWIRNHHTERLTVQALAEYAGMSQASLHRHFKSATGITPLQYQKRLRLQEARIKLLSGADVSETAYTVGYESPSQFSREYSRLFGQAPPPTPAACATRPPARRRSVPRPIEHDVMVGVTPIFLTVESRPPCSSTGLVDAASSDRRWYYGRSQVRQPVRSVVLESR